LRLSRDAFGVWVSISLPAGAAGPGGPTGLQNQL